MDVLTLDELKIINEKINKEIEKKETISASSNHSSGRPKKNITVKKTELRLEPQLYDDLCILAEIDNRSTAGLIRKILRDYVKLDENKIIITNYKEKK